ncbi:hypothetical protein [Microtetraspora malaysiensis]|uniref:Uncharacterized protein n=1 Tax=Microtetraspora malaysiensis TaxID=161358 RepID=A0ABW6SKJ0_9ACTN
MSGTAGSIAGAPGVDAEFEILCDIDANGDATAFMRRLSVDPSGAVVLLDTELDGTTPYAPTGTVGVCPSSVADHEVVELCDVDAGGAVTQFLRRLTIDQAGQVTVVDTELDGTTPYAPTGDVGLCATPELPNPEVDATIQRQTGAGAVAITAGARSVTIVVYTGAPTVAIGGGAAVPILPGTSLSWGVDRGGNVGEALADAFTFTGAAGDDFLVTTTRQA